MNAHLCELSPIHPLTSAHTNSCKLMRTVCSQNPMNTQEVTRTHTHTHTHAHTRTHTHAPGEDVGEDLVVGEAHEAVPEAELREDEEDARQDFPRLRHHLKHTETGVKVLSALRPHRAPGVTRLSPSAVVSGLRSHRTFTPAETHTHTHRNPPTHPPTPTHTHTGIKVLRGLRSVWPQVSPGCSRPAVRPHTSHDC